MPENSSILIAENKTLTALEIAATLNNSGYKDVEIVTSGKTAVEICIQRHPNLVLLDIELQGVFNGMETAKKIAEHEIPVIFLTASEDSICFEFLEESLPYGCLSKPLQAEKLKWVIEMALRKHRLDKELKESQQCLHSILMSFHDGVIATDPANLITFVNSAAERLTGWSKNKALGKECGEVLNLLNDGTPLDVSTFIRQNLDQSEIGIRLNHDRLILSKKNRETLPVDVHVNCLKGESERIKGTVLVIRDRSERQQMSDRMEEHRELLLKLMTRREKEILRWLVNGKSTKETAEGLYISPRTVEFHRFNMMKKLGIHDMVTLIHFALAYKLVPLKINGNPAVGAEDSFYPEERFCSENRN
ncbi:MAG: response regulator [SAR324 cluster bacterium]|nr:response regulator [SAR324 cluster bacterium]